MSMSRCSNENPIVRTFDLDIGVEVVYHCDGLAVWVDQDVPTQVYCLRLDVIEPEIITTIWAPHGRHKGEWYLVHFVYKDGPRIRVINHELEVKEDFGVGCWFFV